jgi:DNA-directed RNA polymerase II subunit RPB1
MFISSLLPANLDYNKYGIVIEDGIMEEGILDVKVLWKSKDSLLKSILSLVGKDRYLHLLHNIQICVDQWLQYYGLTISCNDCRWEDGVKAVQVQYNNVSDSIRSLVTSDDILLDEDLKDIIEEPITAYTSNLKNIVDELYLKELMRRNEEVDNGLLNIVKSGSKGTISSAGQMGGCVGQQFVEGKRSDNQLCFSSNANDIGNLISRGFCINSYSTGLTPEELFHHAKLGREGVIRTAISTSDTGYLQRNIIKFLEDITLDGDGVARDSNNKIIRFVL